jgi:chemotaxis protein methyltransferase CheR
MQETRPKSGPMTVSSLEFERIRILISERYGLLLAPENVGRVRRVMAARLKILGLGSAADYLRKLQHPKGGPEELAHLVDEVANTETYFFREEQQLEVLADEILRERCRRRRFRQRLVIWCAGCSSGEEPFTVAMLLRLSPLWETELRHWDVRILGTDICRKALRRARTGIYGPSSFKGLEPERREWIQRRFFTPEGDRFLVQEELRKSVTFLHLSLTDPDAAGLIGEMDAILCRNVLMYFPPEVRLKVVRDFHGRLAPGGYLLLGHSENLLGEDTPFETCRLRRSLVYRRPAAATSGLDRDRVRE